MPVAIAAAFESMPSVFENLLGAHVDHLESPPDTDHGPTLVCAIAITGDVHGVFQVALGDRLLRRCYRVMTGADSDDPGMMIDTCGEIGNMLAGRLACVFDADSLHVEFMPPMVSPHPISTSRTITDSEITTVLAIAGSPKDSSSRSANDATKPLDIEGEIDFVTVSLITMKGAAHGSLDRR